ncbi:hypothetical protein OG896_24775 [Streptomyces sp. NBC_00669]|nr:hypothetical protein [Streptomyces sp. NBC_00669]
MLEIQESTTPSEAPGGGLVLARRQIAAARARGTAPSDGGSTGRSDGND